MLAASLSPIQYPHADRSPAAGSKGEARRVTGKDGRIQRSLPVPDFRNQAVACLGDFAAGRLGSRQGGPGLGFYVAEHGLLQL